MSIAYDNSVDTVIQVWYDSCMTSDAYRILICIAYMVEINLITSEADIVRWISWPGERVSDALDLLIRRGWLVEVDNRLHLTTEGDSVVQSVETYIYLTDPRKIADFKSKALSGLVEGRVALPRGRRQRTENQRERALLSAIWLKRIHEHTGLDIDEIEEGLTDGRIRWCRRCQSYSVFWRDSRSATGWQAHCRNCV